MNKFRSIIGMRGLSIALVLMLMVSIAVFGAARAVYAEESSGDTTTTGASDTTTTGETTGEDNADEDSHVETDEEKAERKAREKKERIQKGLPYAVIGAVVLLIAVSAIAIPGLTSTKSNRRITTQQLTESALLIAIATVCSIVKIDMPFGGGVTVVSMLPIIMISHRYGWRWGLLTAFAYSIIQLVLGIDNIGQPFASVFMMFGIVFLDYIVAYTVIGLSGIFGQSRKSVAIGIAVTFFLRFVCHYISGVWIWNAWMPESYMGIAMKTPWIYSLLYNGWYMLLEFAITEIVAMLIYKPLKKYFTDPE